MIKFLPLAIALLLNTPVYANSDGVDIQAFCKTAKAIPPGAPGETREQMFPPPPRAFQENDWVSLSGLLDPYSLTPISPSELTNIIKKTDALHVEDNLRRAHDFATLVQERHFVSAQMTLLMAHISLQKSKFGTLAYRFLETIYEPYMDESEVTQGLASTSRNDSDSDHGHGHGHGHEQDDFRLNKALYDDKKRIAQGAKSLGEHVQSSFARWHLQSVVYQDAIAEQTNKNILCSNSVYKSLIPAVIQASRAAQKDTP